MTQSVQTTRPALTTFALIPATTSLVGRVQFVRPATTGQFADAPKTGAAILIKNAFNVGISGLQMDREVVKLILFMALFQWNVAQTKIVPLISSVKTMNA